MSKTNFYNLSKTERARLTEEIRQAVLADIKKNETAGIEGYASDEDTYIRKNAYQALGRIYKENKELRENIFKAIDKLIAHPDEKIRQTMVFALGEIGKSDSSEKVLPYIETGMKDAHHSVRNAAVGSLKTLGRKKPEPVLRFAKENIHSADPEIRRAIIHGIELHGRKHPEDVLPLLNKLQNEANKRVRAMLVHVAGQISYKKGCLPKVLAHLKTWENRDIVKDICTEIIEVHKRYARFSELSAEEAEGMIGEALG
jgi:HEAT repeat protein